jgi:hypothetical protein
MNVFDHCQTVVAPLDSLLGTLLGDLPRLASLLPNVERIEPLGAHWVLGRLTRRDRWVGRPTSAMARWFVPSGAMTWVVRSSWQIEPCVISWELEPTRRPLLVTGSGEVQLSRVSEQRTRVELKGTLAIGGSSVLAARRSSIESLLARLLQSNLLSVFERAEQALAAPPGAPGAFTEQNPWGERGGQPA